MVPLISNSFQMHSTCRLFPSGNYLVKEMASLNPPVRKVQSCGICTIPIPTIVDPRALPCGHVFCRLCLTQMREKMIITCPQCNTALDASMDVSSLPLDYGADFRCDSCYRKGKMSLASQFCKTCTQKMCDHHVEVRQSPAVKEGMKLHYSCFIKFFNLPQQSVDYYTGA